MVINRDETSEDRISETKKTIQEQTNPKLSRSSGGAYTIAVPNQDGCLDRELSPPPVGSVAVGQ